jgi:hypothetical protein
LLASLLKAMATTVFLSPTEEPLAVRPGLEVCFGNTRYALVQSSPGRNPTSPCEFGRRPFAS